MLGSRHYTEKRDFYRMALDCPITYSDIEGLRSRSGQGVDLSAKGIAFEASDNFPIGSLLKIQVSPKLTMTPPFSATVKIVRVERNSAKQNYLLAGLIEEML